MPPGNQAANTSSFNGIRIANGIADRRINFNEHQSLLMYAHIARHGIVAGGHASHFGELSRALKLNGLDPAAQARVSSTVMESLRRKCRKLEEEGIVAQNYVGSDGSVDHSYPPWVQAWARPGWDGDRTKPAPLDRSRRQPLGMSVQTAIDVEEDADIDYLGQQRGVDIIRNRYSGSQRMDEIRRNVRRQENTGLDDSGAMDVNMTDAPSLYPRSPDNFPHIGRPGVSMTSVSHPYDAALMQDEFWGPGGDGISESPFLDQALRSSAWVSGANGDGSQAQTEAASRAGAQAEEARLAALRNAAMMRGQQHADLQAEQSMRELAEQSRLLDAERRVAEERENAAAAETRRQQEDMQRRQAIAAARQEEERRQRFVEAERQREQNEAERCRQQREAKALQEQLYLEAIEQEARRKREAELTARLAAERQRLQLVAADLAEAARRTRETAEEAARKRREAEQLRESQAQLAAAAEQERQEREAAEVADAETRRRDVAAQEEAAREAIEARRRDEVAREAAEARRKEEVAREAAEARRREDVARKAAEARQREEMAREAAEARRKEEVAQEAVRRQLEADLARQVQLATVAEQQRKERAIREAAELADARREAIAQEAADARLREEIAQKAADDDAERRRLEIEAAELDEAIRRREEREQDLVDRELARQRQDEEARDNLEHARRQVEAREWVDEQARLAQATVAKPTRTPTRGHLPLTPLSMRRPGTHAVERSARRGPPREAHSRSPPLFRLPSDASRQEPAQAQPHESILRPSPALPNMAEIRQLNGQAVRAIEQTARAWEMEARDANLFYRTGRSMRQGDWESLMFPRNALTSNGLEHLRPHLSDTFLRVLGYRHDEPERDRASEPPQLRDRHIGDANRARDGGRAGVGERGVPGSSEGGDHSHRCGLASSRWSR
ncbi:hypothetical protein G7046_g7066 [Stylonectria norvegica]|nr:hypothetical protein G7046_g7066 [Stylonectria norvegica]